MDRLGTTAIVTDWSTGNVVQDELHYPWGQEWTMKGTMEEERFAMLQHRDTETSFDPTHSRMYSSGDGRWQTPDSVRACPLHPQNFDRYAYVAGNPTNLVDPKGDEPLWLNPYSGFNDYDSGWGYDETGYLIALGLIPPLPYYPPSSPYGISPFGGFLGPSIFTYQRSCDCTRDAAFPIGLGSLRGCPFTCTCNGLAFGVAFFTVAQMTPKCGAVAEYECPLLVHTVQTVSVIEDIFLPIEIGFPTITDCVPP